MSCLPFLLPFPIEYPFADQRLSVAPLALNFVANISVIVNIHEEILAPFRTSFGVVTEHHAFELHAQCSLRSKQRHTRFSRSAIALAVVAGNTRGNDVHRRVISTTRTRQNVVQSQFTNRLLLAAVLTAELISHVNP